MPLIATEARICACYGAVDVLIDLHAVRKNVPERQKNNQIMRMRLLGFWAEEVALALDSDVERQR